MSLTAQKYTVLLLSAPLGSGHKMAAEALEEAFKKHDNVKVVNGSAFDFFPKWLGNIILGGCTILRTAGATPATTAYGCATF